MKKNNEEKANLSEQDRLYQQEYIPKVHKYGTISMGIILVLSFLPALYFSFVKGAFPGWSAILTAGAAMVGIEIFTWILEPTLYFPMIGITGSYISFVAGNITSMRIPAATAAQSSVGAQLGSRKSEFAGVIGIVSSVIVNFVVLITVVLFGDFIISIMPEAIIEALNYAMPSVFGAMLITFVARLKP